MDEVIRYINLMIRNGNEASSGNLLRELIAFTNMILRDDREVGQNYDPASVIKKIEKLIEKNELEANNLNNKIESLKTENNKDEEIIKKLEKKIKNYEKKYEILHLRINDLFNEKNNIKKKENDELIKKQKEESKKNDTSKKQKEFKFEKYQRVIIYTDGACSGNPGPGGWGAVLISGEHKKEMSGGSKNTTNNIMEMTSILEALKALKQFPIFHNEKRKYQDKTDSIKVDYIDSAKNLVDHANRLFLYKSRTTPVTNVINNEESVKRLDRKLNKLKQIQKSNVKLGSLEAEVESKINNNLDRIIKGIRAQEGEKKNDFLSFK